MSKLSVIGSFIRKYAGEVLVIGDALLTVSRGIGLMPPEQQRVDAAVTKLTDASASILATVDKVDKALAAVGEIKVTKAQVEAAVKAVLPSLVSELVEEGVKQALAKLADEKAAPQQ